MVSRQAVTRVEAISIIFVVVIATVAGIWYFTKLAPENKPATFSMEVTSRPFIPMKGEKGTPTCMPGQRVILLVNVEDIEDGSGFGKAVEISATTSGADVFIYNPSIKPGEVAEMIIVPDQISKNKDLKITVEGHRSGLKQTETFELEVIDWEDDLGEVAMEIRDKFVSWLAINHPEFGLTSETEWTGTIVNPGILVVMHYIFFSEDWEMYLTWHVMMPPYDWARIYLRSRFTEIRSSYAFEISSMLGDEEPHSIELPDWV